MIQLEGVLFLWWCVISGGASWALSAQSIVRSNQILDSEFKSISIDLFPASADVSHGNLGKILSVADPPSIQVDSRQSNEIFDYYTKLDKISIHTKRHGVTQSGNVDCSDPLRCYLNSLVIKFPDTCDKIAGEEVCLLDFQCINLDISSIPSYYTHPQFFSLGLRGLAAQCSGTYTYGLVFTYKGGLTAAISDTGVSLNATLTQDSKSPFYPLSVNYVGCLVDPFNVDVTLDNKVENALISWAIEMLLRNQIQHLFCDLSLPLIQQEINKFFNTTLNPALEYLIETSLPSEIPDYDKSIEYINWSQILTVLNVFSNPRFVSSMSSTLLSSLGGNPFVESLTKKLYSNIEYSAAKWLGSWEFSPMMGMPSFSMNDITTLHGDGLVENVFQCMRRHRKTDENQIFIPSFLINALINKLTNNTGAVVINLSEYDLVINMGNKSLTLLEISFNGLNTFSEVDLLQPTADNTTIESTFALDSLSMTLHVATRIDHMSPIQVDTYEEISTFEFAFSDVTFFMSVTAAVRLDDIRRLHLDQLGDLNCLASAIEVITFNSIAANSSIENIFIKENEGSAGKLEGDITTAINNVFQMATKDMGLLLTETIYALFQGPLRQILNQEIQLLQSTAASQCPSHIPLPRPSYMTWSESHLVKSIYEMITISFGPQGMNQFIDCLTHDTGTLIINVLNKIKVSISNLDSFYELIVFGMVDPDDQSIDSHSMDPYTLHGALGVGGCLDTSHHPIVHKTVGRIVEDCTLTITVTPVLNNEEPERDDFKSFQVALLGMLEKHAEISSNMISRPPDPSEEKLVISISQFHWSMSYLALMDMSTLQALTLEDLSSDMKDHCILAEVMTEIAIRNITANISSLLVTSSLFPPIELAPVVNKLIATMTQPKRISSTNEQIAETLSSLNASCSGIPSPNIDDVIDSTSGIPTWAIATMIVAGVAVIVLLARSYQQYQLRQYDLSLAEALIATGVAAPMDPSASVLDQGLMWLERMYAYDYKNSLLGDELLHPMIRLIILLLILLNISIFIWSNVLTNAATVELVIHAGEKVITAPPLFTFGLISSISEMWDAKVYSLAIIIGLFSCAWPQLKLIAMLIAWIVPSSFKYLSVHQRERLLIILDKYGKWSVIDFFTMLMMMCAFHFELIIIPQIYVVSYVTPHWGFYSFLLATTMSLILGHVVTASHRYAVKERELEILRRELFESTKNKNSTKTVVPDEIIGKDQKHITITDPSVVTNIQENNNPIHHNLENAEQGNTAASRISEQSNYSAEMNFHPIAVRKESLFSHEYVITLRDYHEYYIPAVDGQSQGSYVYKYKACRRFVVSISTFGSILVFMALLAIGLLVLGGGFTNSFQFLFLGMTGYLLGDEDTVQYSMLSVGEKFLSSGGPGTSSVAMRWMQICYLLFAFAMPLASLLFSICMWVFPVSYNYVCRSMVIVEVFNAWSAMDVFCVTVVASVLQIEQFAQFIIGDRCDGINKLLEEYFDDLLNGEDVCFDVIAQVLPTSWCLFAGAMTLFISMSITLNACERAVHDRHRALYPSVSQTDDQELYDSMKTPPSWYQRRAVDWHNFVWNNMLRSGIVYIVNNPKDITPSLQSLEIEEITAEEANN